jgi:hypothetical protein
MAIIITLAAVNIAIIAYSFGQNNPIPQPLGQQAFIYCPMAEFEVAQSTDMIAEVNCR